MNKDHIKTKREELDKARANLKEYFVGIDHIIDQVIDSISAWYIMPELMTRPLIINLWGMTGVGKTDLIRRLVKELKMSDIFVEIQMSSKAPGWEKSIQSKLMMSDIEANKPGILLLDEIQRFRTVDEESAEIRDGDYQDVWMLLSDGKFASEGGAKESILDMMCSILYSKDSKRKKPNTQAPIVVSENTPEDPDEEGDEDEEDRTDRQYKRHYYEARSIKRLLKLDEEVNTIMTWDDDQVMKNLQDKFSDPSFNTEVDYSKTLVFISGNLDEAYRSSTNVSEADRDADDVHTRTKRLNIIDIKNALKRRFKPEQIARFGNTHIIYPSLSKASFVSLIDKRMSMLEKMVKDKNFGVSLSFDQSIKDMIYQNGVFPTQGVRPLYSTIDDFFNKIAPNVILKALDDGDTSVVIKYDGEKDEVFIKGKDEYSIKYIGSLDKIKREKKSLRDEMCSVSVHEAGHAIVYAKLFGYAPNKIYSTMVSSDTEGVVYTPDAIWNKSRSLEMIKVFYAGYCAESMIFGKEKVSNGCASDIHNATKTAAALVRHQGHGSKSTFVITPHQASESTFDFNYEHTDNEILAICNRSKDEASVILSSYKSLLVELTKHLMDFGSMDSELFAEIANKHGLDCKVRDISSVLVDSYEEIFNDFANSELTKRQ